jgi:hypothetical protein
MADHLQRWDPDPKGIGVGDASAMLPVLDALRAQATEPGWVAEEPEHHLLPHLTAAVASTGRLRIVSAVSDEAGRYVVDLAWTDDSDPDGHGLRPALFALVGAIAETATVISEAPGARGRELEVVTGSLPPATPFASHGHTLRLRVVDPDVER